MELNFPKFSNNFLSSHPHEPKLVGVTFRHNYSYQFFWVTLHEVTTPGFGDLPLLFAELLSFSLMDSNH